MILKKLRNQPPSEDLAKIDSSKYDIIWISDYYDGMLSGMLEYNSELFWFEMTRESENTIKDKWFRQYGVIKLSRRQLNKALEIHRDF